MKTLENLIKDEEMSKVKSIEYDETKSIIDDAADDSKTNIKVKNHYVVIYDDGQHKYSYGKLIDEYTKSATTKKYYTTDNDNIEHISKEEFTIKESTNSNDNLEIKTDQEIMYDEYNRAVMKRNFNKLGKEYSFETYNYYGNSKIIKKKTIKGTDLLIYKYYNLKGILAKIDQTNIKSGYTMTTYRTVFDKNGNIEYILDSKYKHKYDIEFDENHNLIKKSVKTYTKNNNNQLIGEKVFIYSTKFPNYIHKIIINGNLVAKFCYDINGSLTQFYKFDNGYSKSIRLERIIENGVETVNKYTRITKDNNIINCNERYIFNVVDICHCLLSSYSKDDGLVQEYKYNENYDRISVTTRKLIGDKFITINEIKYVYGYDNENTDNDDSEYKFVMMDDKLVSTDDYPITKYEYIYNENEELVSKIINIQNYELTKERTEFVSTNIKFNYIDNNIKNKVSNRYTTTHNLYNKLDIDKYTIINDDSYNNLDISDINNMDENVIINMMEETINTISNTLIAYNPEYKI